MNVLPIEKRARILHLLVEGNSMRATSRITDVSINTVTKLLVDAGTACMAFQYEVIRNIKSKCVQCDEIWSFCQSKEKNVVEENRCALGCGGCYTWTAIDVDTKLAIFGLVGCRDVEYAEVYMTDLALRLADRIQLTTDGYGRPYIGSVEKMFSGAIDYAMLVKIYDGDDRGAQKRYRPASVVKAEKCCLNGAPDLKEESASYVERQNLTMRMGMRRFTRLTNGSSKKVESLHFALALHFMHYNFANIHKTLRVTPAMRAGIADHVWSMEEIAGLLKDEAPKERGPYKKNSN